MIEKFKLMKKRYRASFIAASEMRMAVYWAMDNLVFRNKTDRAQIDMADELLERLTDVEKGLLGGVHALHLLGKELEEDD